MAIARATVTFHSLSGVQYLRDSPVPSTGDGAQVGTLNHLHSLEGSGHHSAPKKKINILLRALGAALGAFLLISSDLRVSAVHGVAFPCILCMGEMSWMV